MTHSMPPQIHDIRLLFSFVTTYKSCFLSSRAMPVGDILSGEGAPSLNVSVVTSRLSRIEYSSIQLSLPPEAYNFFSSALKTMPPHDLGITIVSSRRSARVSNS